jgi:methionyl-tRNA formyltransferase
VVAYGLILPRPILEAPRYGCLNLHASALPRWRGAAPIQRAIMAGDTETAVMVMRMDEGLDTGPICLAERVPIGPNTTAGELHDELARVGASLMVRALAALERGSLDATPQPEEGVTYAAKIDKAEARIDFSRPAREVHNLIRGLSPYPGAWFEAGPQGKHERIKVLRSELAEGSGPPGTVLDEHLTVACGEGAVRLTVLQRAGRKPMSAEEFLRGFDLPVGTRLG